MSIDNIWSLAPLSQQLEPHNYMCPHIIITIMITVSVAITALILIGLIGLSLLVFSF